jgi:transposase
VKFPGPTRHFRPRRYELSDYEWAAIKPFLPNKPRGNDRRVLNGIFWVLRSGAPWRDLPENFAPYRSKRATTDWPTGLPLLASITPV